MANANLQAAKAAKKDEFYTQLDDIVAEISHYKSHFKDKTVMCNCDDPRVSNFYRYFKGSFNHLGLKRLICTCYKNQDVDLFSTQETEQAVYIDYQGGEEKILPLRGDGDFRSKECVALLQQADIIVTNPPFSLFREYVAQLMKYKKKFLILGPNNAIHYSDIFKYIKENQVWIGYKKMSQDMLFEVSHDFEIELRRTKKEGSGWRIVNDKFLGRAPAIWYTNLDIKKRHEKYIPCKKYNSEKYPKYYNYDAIDVDVVAEIPEDYYGCMGVPDSFFDYYNPEQFELVGLGRDREGITVDRSIYPEIKKANPNTRPSHIGYYDENGKPKEPYSRIIIRYKQNKDNE